MNYYYYILFDLLSIHRMIVELNVEKLYEHGLGWMAS